MDHVNSIGNWKMRYVEASLKSNDSNEVETRLFEDFSNSSVSEDYSCSDKQPNEFKMQSLNKVSFAHVFQNQSLEDDILLF